MCCLTGRRVESLVVACCGSSYLYLIVHYVKKVLNVIPWTAIVILLVWSYYEVLCNIIEVCADTSVHSMC
jgi:hypothetical protein